MPSADLAQAVRDTVTVESRNRVGRSQTQNPSSPPKQPQMTTKRSQSQDSAQYTSSKSRSKGSKKSSQHADVIDRLDFTGVGPMFHHDGPFDACAPSRNRHKTKAPMMAWTPRPEDQTANGGPYPSPNAYQAFQEHYEPPKKKVDAIAEAWGIHEPEPFEEFFAGGGTKGDTPASSIYNGRDSHSSPRKHGKERRDHTDDAARARSARRSTLPPPQPIFIHDAQDDPTATPSNTAFPKRSKSIMQRIRKMRDAPNIPVPAEFDEPPSPSSSPQDAPMRPTHRSQNSFLGKLNGGSKPDQQSSTEPFVYIDAHTNKDLPATPGAQENGAAGYFDGTNGSAAPASPGGGLGRKASLMKKVGRVVRGTR